MHELARVTLQNEMDLILAHKRSMKLAELGGLSLSAQTTFATAVSEVSRIAIESEKGGCLILSVETEKRDKYIVASFKDERFNLDKHNEGLEYAKRLVNKYNVFTNAEESSIELFCHISPAFRIDIHKLDEWRKLFRNEPPVSPYDELKRKNEQLQDLSEKIQKSEAQYRTLTSSLPMIIFSLDTEGQLLYANEWLTKYTGETFDDLNRTKWESVVHEADYDTFSLLLKNPITKGSVNIKINARLKQKHSGDYLWHQVSLSPIGNDEELKYWIGYIVDIHAQKVYEETLKDNIELKQIQQELKENEQKLQKYIDELARSNHELQQFAFVASHDLQEPVRKILFYSDFLLSRNMGSLDQKSLAYLNSMQAASQRMRNLIQDLLTFSLINKEEVAFKNVDLNEVANEAVQDFEMAIEEKGAVLKIAPLPVINGDPRMLRQLFENIISNSLKYSKASIFPVINISCRQNERSVEILFTDNGIGFNNAYLPQMFTLFQRLHDRTNYEGTGLGLAICRKIVEVHGGKIWAEGKEEEGCTFFVSFPLHHSGN